MYLYTDSGDVDMFEVKLISEMLTVRGKQHSFSTHERSTQHNKPLQSAHQLRTFVAQSLFTRTILDFFFILGLVYHNICYI